MAEPLVIAIVGAESTGKTVLARALAEAIGRSTGLTSTWVPEALREWCDREGRTPARHEQAAIARLQHERIATAAAAHAVVVADTTALTTAVYSRIVFGDGSLDDWAAGLHRACTLTLLTALDLPWEADGFLRDGAHVREPVDALLRDLMRRHAIVWSRVVGQGRARLQSALDACAPGLAGGPARPPAARSATSDRGG